MKIVIDIDDDDYKRIQDISDVFFSLTSRTYSAIRNGTPLPKVNGRLMVLSENRLKENQINLDWSCQKWISEVGLSNATIRIIKADKECEDKHTEERTEMHACDCISREAALDCLVWRWPEKTPATKIMELPSVEPERKSGKVVFKHRHHHNVKHYTGEDLNGEIHKISVLEDYEVDEPYCSECGKRIDNIQGRFCACCGVRLEVDG